MDDQFNEFNRINDLISEIRDYGRKKGATALNKEGITILIDTRKDKTKPLLGSNETDRYFTIEQMAYFLSIRASRIHKLLCYMGLQEMDENGVYIPHFEGMYSGFVSQGRIFWNKAVLNLIKKELLK